MPHTVANESIASHGEFLEANSRLTHFQGRRLELLHIGVPVLVLGTHLHGGCDVGGALERHKLHATYL